MKIYCDESVHDSHGFMLLAFVICDRDPIREKISGEPKILVYGDEAGFDPPIEADLGYELWASLRYSMRRSNQSKGKDMPEMACFDTKGFGFFLADNCPKELVEAAESLFGEVYLGCIH